VLFDACEVFSSSFFGPAARAADCPTLLNQTFEHGFNGANGVVRKNRIHEADEVACRADWILV
jgi:hypothetical protein